VYGCEADTSKAASDFRGRRAGWEPRFEDYLYVAMTNGIAFSPTDAMPLTLSAKRLRALESLNLGRRRSGHRAARAVNVIHRTPSGARTQIPFGTEIGRRGL
jgi:hypothetical protein